MKKRIIISIAIALALVVFLIKMSRFATGVQEDAKYIHKHQVPDTIKTNDSQEFIITAPN